MQYHSEKFIIVKKLKKFILDLETLLINFPKKDFINKDNMYKESINILELIYIANNTIDKIKKKEIIIKVLAKISILDFYLERAFAKRYISEKQCLTKSGELSEITKMIYKWVKMDE